MEHNPSSSRADRKTVEKNRRNLMKSLYSKLNSLIPDQDSRGSVPGQIDGAVNYIKKLQMNLEKMKQKKESLKRTDDHQNLNAGLGAGESGPSRLPQIEIKDKGSALQVVLITGMDYQFMFCKTIRILHEEEVEVVNAGFSILDNTIFHTIHSKIGGPEEEYALRAARISERLNKFVCEASSFDDGM